MTEFQEILNDLPYEVEEELKPLNTWSSIFIVKVEDNKHAIVIADYNEAGFIVSTDISKSFDTKEEALAYYQEMQED